MLQLLPTAARSQVPYGTAPDYEPLNSTHRQSFPKMGRPRMTEPFRPVVQHNWIVDAKVDTLSTAKAAFQPHGLTRTQSYMPAREYAPDPWAPGTLATTSGKSFRGLRGDYRREAIRPEPTLTMDYYK